MVSHPHRLPQVLAASMFYASADIIPPLNIVTPRPSLALTYCMTAEAQCFNCGLYTEVQSALKRGGSQACPCCCPYIMQANGKYLCDLHSRAHALQGLRAWAVGKAKCPPNCVGPIAPHPLPRPCALLYQYHTDQDLLECNPRILGPAKVADSLNLCPFFLAG